MSDPQLSALFSLEASEDATLFTNLPTVTPLPPVSVPDDDSNSFFLSAVAIRIMVIVVIVVVSALCGLFMGLRRRLKARPCQSTIGGGC
ncbi:hypothetical protein C8R45DRAFT_1088194 [Mycena sanguinolenta]|nr:hypothetical protein C8R45DRAFT_1088194 [Mycena sanguinolenta]